LIFANHWLCQWFTILNGSALNVPSFARGLWPQLKATGFAGGRLFTNCVKGKIPEDFINFYGNYPVDIFPSIQYIE